MLLHIHIIAMPLAIFINHFEELIVLNDSITTTHDLNVINDLIEESEELDRQVCPDFIVYDLRHPTEGHICLVKGALTDYAVITEVVD